MKKYRLIENVAFRKPKKLGEYKTLLEVLDRVNSEMIKKTTDPENAELTFWSEVELNDEDITSEGIIIAGIKPIKAGGRAITIYCLEVQRIIK